MSVAYIPEKTKWELWLRAGGRCEYSGCNKPLWRESLTLRRLNTSYIAHIIADKPGGPRGDPVLSHKLRKALSNLMLLCDEHHRLIDRDIAEHPVELLQRLKRDHEERIEWLTGLMPKRKTHILSFTTNIGPRKGNVAFEDACEAILAENRYPASDPGIEINLTKSEIRDHEEAFWQAAQAEIARQVETGKSQKYNGESVRHLSVFAIAPIPLLIQLGKNVGDITFADVYQPHRDTNSWKWQKKRLPPGFSYVIEKPSQIRPTMKQVVLVLSLSGTIGTEEIHKAMGGDFDLYSLTIKNPHRDFLKSKQQLRLFKDEICRIFREIREQHGSEAELHIFPAIPASVAVEIGRCILPKVDPRMHIYDHHRDVGGFRRVLTIK